MLMIMKSDAVYFLEVYILLVIFFSSLMSPVPDFSFPSIYVSHRCTCVSKYVSHQIICKVIYAKMITNMAVI